MGWINYALNIYNHLIPGTEQNSLPHNIVLIDRGEIFSTDKRTKNHVNRVFELK